MKLALGTVQFGCDYGISNKKGQVSLQEVESILTFCKKNNILTLDTAQGYGNSEEVLGQFDLSPFKVVTKIIGNMSLEKSLENLNLSNVYGVMFHRENEINDISIKKYQRYKEQGLVEKVGVSVYSPQKLEEIIARYEIDLVQIPLNLLDQRFLPLLSKLKEKNIEIHTRSTFLQGLLLMDIAEIHSYFLPIKNILDKISEPKLQTCLAFVKNISEIDSVVVGCTSLKELQEIIHAYKQDIVILDYAKFSTIDETYINPSKWKI